MGTFTPQYTSPFDITAISKAVDAALITLKPEEHGSVVVQLNSSGAAATLVLKGPGKSSILATITKPMAGPVGWNVSGKVSFALAEELPIRPNAIFWGWYRLLKDYNGYTNSLIKAFLLCLGNDVKLKG